MSYRYTMTITEDKRSAFGRGWEARRRGETIDDNPFVFGSQPWLWFRSGWSSFKDRDIRRIRRGEDGCCGR